METTQLYILQAGDYFKIGITKSLRNRVKQIQTGCPIEIRSVYFVEFNSRTLALEAEKKLHEFFNKTSSSGEWFVAKKGWLVNAENSLRVIKNDLLLYLKIYKINNKQSYYEYKDVLSRINENKSLAMHNKIVVLNEYKRELIKGDIFPELQINIDRAIERYLKKIAISEMDVNKEDFNKIINKQHKNMEYANKVKEISVKKYEDKKIETKNITLIKDAKKAIKKCFCEKDLKTLDKLQELFPALKSECMSRRKKIEKKVKKAFDNIPGGLKCKEL